MHEDAKSRSSWIDAGLQSRPYDVCMSDLRPEVLSWTALLGRWIDYARASLALPADDEGSRWKESVTAIINLQAATFALGELAQLVSKDQPLAVDRADVLIGDAHSQLDAIWGDADWPPSLQEIVEAAHAAVQRGVVIVTGWELHWPGPGSIVMPIIELPECAGTLLVMMPGTIVMPGEPVSWGRCTEPLEIDGCALTQQAEPRQVYRAMDETGAITGDVVSVIDDNEPPAGLPLLVPCVVEGIALGHFPLEPDEWLARQRAGLGDDDVIDVRVVEATTPAND